MDILAAAFSNMEYNSNTAITSNPGTWPQSVKSSAASVKNPTVPDTVGQSRHPRLQGPREFDLYNGAGASISYKQFSYDSLTVNYTSKDGDKLQLQWESAKYTSLVAATTGMSEAEGSVPNSIEDIVADVKAAFLELKQEIIKTFVEANGGEYQEVDTEYNEEEIAELEAKMPEYWNAENTSQRIVDFATAFFGIHGEDSLDEFLEDIKAAIDQGFGEARDEMGEVPSVVEGLTNKTYELVMKKLDAWAEETRSMIEWPENQVA